MAGFQNRLTESTAPAASKNNYTGGQVAVPSTAQTIATVGTSLFEIANKGMAIFDDIEKKEVTEDYNIELLNLVEAKNQGTINNTEFNTQVNTKYVEHGKRNPEHLQLISGITKDTIGFVPFATEAKAGQSIDNSYLQIGAALRPDGSSEEQMEIGREIFVAQTKVANSKASLEANLAKSRVEQRTILADTATYMDNLVDSSSLNVLLSSSQVLASEASTLTQKEQANSALQQVESLLKTVKTQYISSLSGITDNDTYTKAVARFETYEKAQLDLFDPVKGPLNLQQYSLFATAMKNNMQMSTMQTSQTLSAIKEVIGSQALGTIMNQVIIRNPQTETALLGMLEAEVNNLVSGAGLSEEQGVRFSTVLQAIKSPERAEILATSGDVRTDKLTQNIGIFTSAMNQQAQTDDVVEGGWANGSLTYAQMGIAHLTKPENIHIVTKSFNNSGHTRNLNKLEQLNPQLAQEVGQRVQTVAVKDLTSLLRTQKSKYVKYDTSQKKFVPFSREEIQNSSPTQTRRGAINSGLNSANTFVTELNTALSVAVAHAKYDPVSAKIEPTKIKDYFVKMGQISSGTDYLKGEKLSEINLKETPASISEVSKFFKPSNQEFNIQATAIEEKARTARTGLLRRISFQSQVFPDATEQ